MISNFLFARDMREMFKKQREGKLLELKRKGKKDT